MVRHPRPLTRRTFLTASGLAVASLSLGACSGSDQQVGNDPNQPLLGKTVRVGLFGQPPYAVPEGNTYTGLGPEVANLLLPQLGAESIEYSVVDFAGLIPSLVAKRIDIIAAGLYITPERCGEIAYADPDLRMGDAMIVAAGNPRGIHSLEDVASTGSRIGTGSGSDQAQRVLDAGVPEGDRSLYPDPTTALASLRAGREDAIYFTAGSIAGLLVANDGATDIELVEPFQQPTNENGEQLWGYAAFGFRKEDAAWIEPFNKALSKAKRDDSLRDIVMRFGLDEGAVPPEDITAASLCEPAR